MVGTILIPDVASAYNKPGIVNKMGCFYKTVRLYKSITKKEVCSKVSISRQYLGRLEDETAFFSISRQLCNKLNQALQINPDVDSSVIEQFYVLKNDFLQGCLSFRGKKAIAAFSTLCKRKSELENTICFPEYLLLEMVYSVLYEFEKENNEELILLLNKIHLQFDNRTRQIYYLYLSIYKLHHGLFDEVEELLKNAGRLCNDVQVLATIQLVYSALALNRNSPLDAVKSTLRAKEMYDSICNYRGSVRCMSHLALVWSHMKEYDGAAYLCLQSTITADSIDFKEIIPYNYRILTRISLLSGNYEDVFNYANIAAELGENSTEIDFFVCYAHWKLEQFTEVEKRVSLSKNHIQRKKDMYYLLMRHMRRLVRNPNEKESVFLKMIQLIKNQNSLDYSVLRMLHMEMVLFYRQRRNYKPALEHYEIVLGLSSID